MLVGGTDVLVGGTGVLVGGTGVLVGGMGVSVAEGSGVSEAGDGAVWVGVSTGGVLLGWVVAVGGTWVGDGFGRAKGTHNFWPTRIVVDDKQLACISLGIVVL